MQDDTRFHAFAPDELGGVELPGRFTYPFNYVPHRLCVVAAGHLQRYVATRDDWQDELACGKMMGVLVVENDGVVGFLAAFSGNLAHSNNHDYFVPAVYDFLSRDGFFVPEENAISEINRKIEAEMNCDERLKLEAELSLTEMQAKTEIEAFQVMMKKSKSRRDLLREQGADEEQLMAESRFQKAELRRRKQHWNKLIESVKSQLACRDAQVAGWKEERQRRSVALQTLIFRHFEMLNGRGEKRNLCDIFADARHELPPAGTGECAAPKLLQYAYQTGCKPLAMAEFWVGESPKDEVRRHGCYYPSCKSKCEPVLNWMLQGLDVDPNPDESQPACDDVTVLYEDEWIIAVDKPAGMLSVPGKLSVDSLQQRVQKMYPGETLCVVHRLDMDTSGVMLFARTRGIHKQLQAMFKSRDIAKCYIALLDGDVTDMEGEISLPLVANPDDRPRQMVSSRYGKPALTRYEIADRKNGFTVVRFYPVTGRTHQLRVHAAHRDGLNAPIRGDRLYGMADDRLYLHAHWVGFVHPQTGENLKIITPIPF